jgi:hypothetical protein
MRMHEIKVSKNKVGIHYRIGKIINCKEVQNERWFKMINNNFSVQL